MIGTATEKALDPTERSAQARQLELALRARIVGQEEALHAVVSVYQVFLAGMNLPNHPVGTLLFLGPTGSGKTRVVEAVAEALFGDVRALLQVDCGEFQHSHEKANDALWQLLLGVLDRATLTLGDNRRVDFSQTLIFLTSNLGAAEMASKLGGGIGFGRNRALLDARLERKLKIMATEAARRKFAPEFLNRIDKVVP